MKIWIIIIYIVGMSILSSPASISQSYHVGTIFIDRHQIFDQPDSSFIENTANSLHILTKEHVIQDQLLFHSGDPYDTNLVAECERNLRSLDYIGDVAIIPDTLNDSTINLRVVTHDKWTLGLNTSYQQDGGVQSITLSMKDDNFLGQGQSLSVGYGYQSDLDDPHSTEVIFRDQLLFGSRWGTTLQFKTSQDQRLRTMLVQRPFYSDETPWSASFYADYGHILVPFYENGVRTGDQSFDQQTHNAYYSWTMGDGVIVRPGIAWIGIMSQGQNLRTNDNLEVLASSINLMDRTYYKESFLNNHGRVEDVPAGFVANVLAGNNFYFPHGNEPQTMIQASWLQAFLFNPAWYFSYAAAASTFLGHGAVNESTFEWNLLHFVKLLPRNVLVARTYCEMGMNWLPGRQLILGSSTGLRGYGDYAFVGNRLFVCNLEDRIFPDVQWWIFRPGMALFYDGGTTWNEGDPLSRERFHQSAGFGLRIENIKQEGSGIVRVDLAYNFDERRIGGISISSNVLFSAFNDIGFISPITKGLF